MTMYVIKQYATLDEASRVFEWYKTIDRRFVPRELSLLHNDRSVVYRFVDGLPAWRPDLVWDVLKRAVWEAPRREPSLRASAVLEYCRYVKGVWDEHYGALSPFEGVINSLRSGDIDLILETVLSQVEYMTPALQVHGDATMLNFMQQHDDSIVIIDPGHPRGLLVRELDEAKMLQSAEGYDQACTGRTAWNGQFECPFVPRMVHHALLTTHCIRLVPHQARHGRHDLVRWAIEYLRSFVTSRNRVHLCM